MDADKTGKERREGRPNTMKVPAPLGDNCTPSEVKQVVLLH